MSATTFVLFCWIIENSQDGEKILSRQNEKLSANEKIGVACLCGQSHKIK